LQIQDLIKIANAVNNQLADIVTILLQTGEMHKIQIGGDIYNILKELQNVIYRDMEKQAYYIKVLLGDKPDQCKRKGVEMVDEHIKILHEVY